MEWERIIVFLAALFNLSLGVFVLVKGRNKLITAAMGKKK